MHDSSPHHCAPISSANTNDATTVQSEGAPVLQPMTEFDLAGLTALVTGPEHGSDEKWRGF